MRFFRHIVENLRKKKKLSSYIKRGLIGSSAVIVFITIYALILPAVAIDRDEADNMPGLYLEETTSEAEEFVSVSADGAGDYEPETDESAYTDVLGEADPEQADELNAADSVPEDPFYENDAETADTLNEDLVGDASELSVSDPSALNGEYVEAPEEWNDAVEEGTVSEDYESDENVVFDEADQSGWTDGTDGTDGTGEDTWHDAGESIEEPGVSEDLNTYSETAESNLYSTEYADEYNSEYTDEYDGSGVEQEQNETSNGLSAEVDQTHFTVIPDASFMLPSGSELLVKEYHAQNADPEQDLSSEQSPVSDLSDPELSDPELMNSELPDSELPDSEQNYNFEQISEDAKLYTEYAALANSTLSMADENWIQAGTRLFSMQIAAPDGSTAGLAGRTLVFAAFPETSPVQCRSMQVVQFVQNEDGTTGCVILPSVFDRNTDGQITGFSFEADQLSIFGIVWSASENEAADTVSSIDPVQEVPESNPLFPEEESDGLTTEETGITDSASEEAESDVSVPEDTESVVPAYDETESEDLTSEEAAESGSLIPDESVSEEDGDNDAEPEKLGVSEIEETESTEETAEDVPEDVSEDDSEGENEAISEENEKENSEGESKQDVTYPAQVFSRKADDLLIQVYAGEGAFPAGSTMTVETVQDPETIEAIKETVEKTVSRVNAVNITFFDADGKEIEPLIPIRVVMTGEESNKDESIHVVHVDDEGHAETVEDVTLVERNGVVRAGVIDETVAESDAHVDEDTAVLVGSESEEGTDDAEITKEGTDAAETNEEETTEAEPDTQTDLEIVEPKAEPAYEAETEAEAEPVYAEEADTGADSAVFSADSFSVYALVYTVDFEYSVNGETYQFSLPGGGYVSFTDLVEVLGITDDTDNEESTEDAEGTEDTEDTEGAEVPAEDGMLDITAGEAAKQFVQAVESIEFSSPEYVWVGKADAETTVGALKEANGLKTEYSAELTEEQIDRINSTAVGSGDWALISVQPFTSEEELTVTMKDGEVFTVKVTDAQITTMFLSDSGELYEVTVTYGSDAQIPDGATLKVTELAEGSDDFRYAWKTVLADKQARDEEIDFSNLSALDISILDAEGNEIEPAAPVQVDLTIKSLPGVEDLSEVADTLAIQHHVETEDGIVVETVYDGGTEASFRMDTNEAVAAEGKAVDPDAADLSAFEFSSFDLYSDGSIVTNAPETEDDEIEVSFPTPVFSTFTVTWNNNSTTSNQLRVSQLSNGKYILYARDAANNNDYALVPGTALNSVQVTVNGDLVQYSGSENLYWDVETSGSGDNQRIYFSFTQNGTKYYLAAGKTGNKVTTNRNRNGYGDANTTEWRQWDNCIHSAGDTFLQSYNGTFRTWNVAGIYPFQDRSAVYFEKQGAGASNSSATIHYVDENGNELTVSNGQPVNDTNGNLNYLIYDVNGYEYAYTYRNANTSSNRITPILRYRNNRWQYTTGTDRDGYNSWTNLSQDDDIYVVYKPKASVPEGGTPVPKITGERPDAPTITKDSMVNGDGTNTLSLSVTGHTSIMEAEKLADVIVVYDVSGSMRFRMDSETDAYVGQRRMDYAQAATKALAKSLLGKNTTEHPDLIRMALISFSNTAQKVQDFTADKTTFIDAVDDLPAPDGGTNWEYALQIANEMAVESDRATFVIFVTDGNPTFRQTRGTLNNSSTNNGLGVTQYNASLGYTVGDVGSYFYQYRVYGGGDNDDWGRNYAAALVQAKSIVSHSKNFYTIGISNDVTNLTKLTTEAGAGADHSKTATSNEELVAAFDDIAASIIAHLGHSDVKITDGITDLTQTVQKSSLVNFAEDDFTYYKKHDYDIATQKDVDEHRASAVGEKIQVNGDWETWNPTSEGCAEAVYNTATGAVEWNMGETFMLEDGYTYQVRFKVWPSQAAYDLLADLNNGVKTYASLSESEKAQIKEPTTAGGMYTLKTNSDTSYTYREATKSGDTVTPTGEPSEPGSFPDVDPLELTTRPLKVKKQWHNNYVDSRTLTDSITLELYGVDTDGVTSHDFKEITLTSEGNWYAENNFISYGLVTYDTATNAGEKIYETGHDFTLRETDDEAHYYELTAGIFRPMFINGTPTILERVDAAPAGMGGSVFHYNDGTCDYYRLNGHVYRSTQSDILLIATNSHRSFMDLNKVVVDEAGNTAVDDTKFEYKITFKVPSGIANYDTLEKYIWFSVYDTVEGRTLAPGEYTATGVITPAQENAELYSGDQYANYLVATSGQEMTLKIRQGWNVRFLNLPIGTTYSFKEVSIPEGYNFVKAEVSGTRWIANMEDGTDRGNAVTMTDLPSNTSASNSNTVISGTIDFANARYNTTYTNRTDTQHVQILKTSQNGTTPLPGAVFSLYTKSGYEADPKKASKTGLTSDANGQIDLGKLAIGTYYLAETSAPDGYILLPKPVVITASADGVNYNQSDSSLSMSKSGISYDQTTKTYTLTVTNNAGIELPSTGGPGTRVFTTLGSILLLGAGILLLRRRRPA